MNNEHKELSNWRERVNDFIKKWCGIYASHLLDSDENDGQELRDLLRSEIQSSLESVEREIERMEKEYKVKRNSSESIIGKLVNIDEVLSIIKEAKKQI